MKAVPVPARIDWTTSAHGKGFAGADQLQIRRNESISQRQKFSIAFGSSFIYSSLLMKSRILGWSI